MNKAGYLFAKVLPLDALKAKASICVLSSLSSYFMRLISLISAVLQRWESMFVRLTFISQREQISSTKELQSYLK